MRHNRVDTPLVDTVNQKLISIFFSYTLSLSIIFSSVANDGIECSLYFGPGSVTLTVMDLIPEITIISREIPLAAWNLVLSQMKDFLIYHLALVPIIPNQEVNMEMRDEMVSSVGAEDVDTSGYQVFDPDS